MFRKAFFLFLILFLFSHGAEALGIGPTPVEMTYVPGYSFSSTVYVTNSLDTDFPVDMSIDGEFADYVNLQGDKYFVLGPKGYAVLKYSMVLPEGVVEPGSHVTRILVTQSVPPDAPTGGIAARIQAAARIIVWVPYPGKYIDLDFDVKNPRINQTITFKIKASNRGNETIDKATVMLHIMDMEGNEIAAVNSDTRSIAGQDDEEFVINWFATGIPPGEYTASSVIDYDGENKSIERLFRIGAPTIRIVSVTSDPIMNNSIGRITATVASEWNMPIEGVFAEIRITDEKGYDNIVPTPTVTVNPFEQKGLLAYWDTSDANGVGNYTALLTLYYLGQNVTTTAKLQVVAASFGMDFGLIAAILAIVIILALLAVILRRKRRKKSRMIQMKIPGRIH